MKRILIAMFALTLVASVAMAGSGKGHSCGKAKGDKLGSWIEAGLEDSQIEDLIEMKAEHMKKALPLKREISELSKRKHELMKDVQANENELKEVASNLAEKMVEKKVMHEQHMASMKKLLTDEQASALFGCQGCQGGDCDGHGKMMDKHGKGHGKKMMKHGA